MIGAYIPDDTLVKIEVLPNDATSGEESEARDAEFAQHHAEEFEKCRQEHSKEIEQLKQGLQLAKEEFKAYEEEFICQHREEIESGGT